MERYKGKIERKDRKRKRRKIRWYKKKGEVCVCVCN